MLRNRPTRARIFQPVLRLGVVATDWKYIIGITVVCYLAPIVLNVDLFGLPLFLISGPAAMFLSYLFFYLTRVGRRPRWLQHKVRALLLAPVERAALPVDRVRNPPHPWLRRNHD
jgi:hypothetical protein